MNYKDDPLYQYCKNANQRETFRAWFQNGKSCIAAAKMLGKGKSTVSECILRIKHNAALHGFSPEHNMHHSVPDGFFAKGVSNLYGEDGALKLSWVKSEANAKRQAEIRNELYAAMAKELKPLDPIPHGGQNNKDRLVLIPIADPHFGMRAWAKESGEDWSLEKAEKVIWSCYFEMIEQLPAASECVIAVLGDFFHANGNDGVTPRNKHVLDLDSRWQESIEVGVSVLRRIINNCLVKFNRVKLEWLDGNHDEDAGAFMRVMLKALYEDEKRIVVETSPYPYRHVIFGNNFIGLSHGHLKQTQKPLELAMVYADIDGYSSSRYRELHTAHRHSYAVVPFHGGRVIQHSTLIPRDAYASSMGYKSIREAVGKVYHREHGPGNDVIVRPAYFE